MIADGPSHWTVLERVRAARGQATAHRCAECEAEAACWSYDGSDLAELTCPRRGYRYSLDLDRYRPRCRSCHRRRTDRRPQQLDTARVVRLYVAGATARAIAGLLDTTLNAVYAALHDAEIPTRTTHSSKPRDNDRNESQAHLSDQEGRTSTPASTTTTKAKPHTHTEASRSHGAAAPLAKSPDERTDQPC